MPCRRLMSSHRMSHRVYVLPFLHVGTLDVSPRNTMYAIRTNSELMPFSWFALRSPCAA
jgi:hypothetical protein